MLLGSRVVVVVLAEDALATAGGANVAGVEVPFANNSAHFLLNLDHALVMLEEVAVCMGNGARVTSVVVEVVAVLVSAAIERVVA